MEADDQWSLTSLDNGVNSAVYGKFLFMAISW